MAKILRNKKRPIYAALSFVLSVFVCMQAFGYERSIKSGNLPEKYDRVDLFLIAKKKMLEFRRLYDVDQGGEENSNYFPYGDKGQPFGVDGQDNVYVMFDKAVLMFDKKGALLSKLDLPETVRYAEFLVDQSGNFVIWNFTVLPHRAFFYNQTSGFLSRIPPLVTEFNQPNFVNGTVYSENTGKVFYSITNKEKMDQPFFLSDLKKFGNRLYRESLGQDSILPDEIDGYSLIPSGRLDKNGHLFMVAEDNVDVLNSGEDPDPRDAVWETTYRIYVFDSLLHLRAVVPANCANKQFEIDFETGNVYSFSAEKDGFRAVKWMIRQ